MTNEFFEYNCGTETNGTLLALETACAQFSSIIDQRREFGLHVISARSEYFGYWGTKSFQVFDQMSRGYISDCVDGNDEVLS